MKYKLFLNFVEQFDVMARKKYLIVMAVGSGTRMGGDIPKQFMELDGKAVLHRTIEVFLKAVPDIKIVTVLPDKSENFQSYANTVELFQEIEKLDCMGAIFILDNSKNRDKLKINEIFFTHLNALLANEKSSTHAELL